MKTRRQKSEPNFGYTRAGRSCDSFRNAVRLGENLLTLIHPSILYGSQYTWESRATELVLRRKVSTCIEGLQVRCQKYGVGPAAAVRHQLGRCHINFVEVRPFFSVHLDVDKPQVHQLGNLQVREHPSLHHMAPVAGGVAYREEYWLCSGIYSA